MECYTRCQSCGMPMDKPQLYGTEKNGAKSTLFCIYCYQDGAFTHQEWTIEDMKVHVRTMLERSAASEDVIREALNNLPFLIRWLIPPVLRPYRSNKQTEPCHWFH